MSDGPTPPPIPVVRPYKRRARARAPSTLVDPRNVQIDPDTLEHLEEPTHVSDASAGARRPAGQRSLPAAPTQIPIRPKASLPSTRSQNWSNVILRAHSSPAFNQGDPISGAVIRGEAARGGTIGGAASRGGAVAGGAVSGGAATGRIGPGRGGAGAATGGSAFRVPLHAAGGNRSSSDPSDARQIDHDLLGQVLELSTEEFRRLAAGLPSIDPQFHGLNHNQRKAAIWVAFCDLVRSVDHAEQELRAHGVDISLPCPDGPGLRRASSSLSHSNVDGGALPPERQARGGNVHGGYAQEGRALGGPAPGGSASDGRAFGGYGPGGRGPGGRDPGGHASRGHGHRGPATRVNLPVVLPQVTPENPQETIGSIGRASHDR